MGLMKHLKAMLRGGKTDISARYVRLREAISGTMSKFYMARDRQTGKIVGLKILDRVQSALFEARFKGLNKPTEGEISTALPAHPHLVKTFEHGLTTEDEQYLVMEFIEGQGINSLITGASELLDSRHVELIRQAAQALDAVHEAGFIHRDVCPRNFIVSPDGQNLKLIDFGLTVPDKQEFKKPGNRTGTPNYMSPEVIRRQRTDKRLDIFSFGVTAFELCTFELPWPHCNTGPDAMRHATEDPTPIDQYRPKIHPKLAEVIHRCLKVEPSDRFQSMKQLIDMLAGLEHEDQ